MFFLYCCNGYLCPYITQHHKITEIVVFNVHTQLLSGTAVGQIPLIVEVKGKCTRDNGKTKLVFTPITKRRLNTLYEK
jgi:hypothetical protein